MRRSGPSAAGDGVTHLLDGEAVRAWVRDGVLTIRGEYDAVIELVRQRLAGAPRFLGEDRSPEEVVCQVAPCHARRLAAADFLAEIDRGGPFRDAARWYARAERLVCARLAACNALHGVEERCARWLLMTRDLVGANEFTLTQEYLAQMLGGRRPTVTAAAGSLQSAGLITYRHGRITITDPGRLEEAACECYGAVRHAFARPIP
jgi:CRP-like cAMP-binding protein